jgi:hypothetical protein
MMYSRYVVVVDTMCVIGTCGLSIGIRGRSGWSGGWREGWQVAVMQADKLSSFKAYKLSSL